MSIDQLKAAFVKNSRIQAWHLLPVSRADARKIAILAAHTLGAHHSYVPNDGSEFRPHEWVVEAILQAANMRSSKDGEWCTLVPKDGTEPKFSCPEHLYRVHPEDPHQEARPVSAADIDVMRDVYMTRDQRAAYERILATAALSPFTSEVGNG